MADLDGLEQDVAITHFLYKQLMKRERERAANNAVLPASVDRLTTKISKIEEVFILQSVFSNITILLSRYLMALRLLQFLSAASHYYETVDRTSVSELLARLFEGTGIPVTVSDIILATQGNPASTTAESGSL